MGPLKDCGNLLMGVECISLVGTHVSNTLIDMIRNNAKLHEMCLRLLHFFPKLFRYPSTFERRGKKNRIFQFFFSKCLKVANAQYTIEQLQRTSDDEGPASRENNKQRWQQKVSPTCEVDVQTCSWVFGFAFSSALLAFSNSISLQVLRKSISCNNRWRKLRPWMSCDGF